MVGNRESSGGYHGVRLVCVTKSGGRYHKLSEGRRLKDAACGGFDSTRLIQISREKAEERGYTPCKNCYQDTASSQEGDR